MKSKLIPISIIILIIIIALVLAMIFIFGTNNYDKLIKNENVQIAVLSNIYKDVLTTINTNDGNISLDTSALKNIITNEEFSESNSLKLKNIEKIDEDKEITYTIYTKYLEETHTISIEIIQDDIGYMKHTQEYKLYYEDGKINFERNGEGITLLE